MLLALDVGNTNTKLGLYRLDGDSSAAKPALVATWRVTTHHQQTADEYSVLFVNLFKMNGIEPSQVTHIIISSVVPPVETTLRQVCETCFHVDPLFVEPGIKTGMPVLVDNPTELGADRLADSIAAYERYGGPCIVVNFGTATRFEVISARGEYLGGAISPGLGISANALFSHAARLSRVDIKRPAKVIGTNTITHLQSGLYYGYIGLVDGILERMLEELKERMIDESKERKPDELMPAEPNSQPESAVQPRVIACGGLAHMIAEGSRYITDIDDMLTLDGLVILFERNRTARPRNRPH
jgi:type III pantothenate kinase